MQQTGFSADDMKQGWSLVLTACSAPTVNVTSASTTGPVVEATQKLEEWQSAMLPRAQAALHRLHPEQEAFIFDNLISGQNAAVVNVALFLDRCDALQNAPERKSTRKADHAALATLGSRGINEAARKQGEHLVHVIESTPAPIPTDTSDLPPDARTEALTELHAWVQDWSGCARTVIARRDQLIRLGIGKRRARSSAAPVTTPPVAATPVAPVEQPVALPAAPSAPVLVQSAPPRALLPAHVNGVNGAASHA